MAKCLRFALLLIFAVFGWVSVASASATAIQTVAINEITDCFTQFPCSFMIPGSGQPDEGTADFTPIGLPWTFDFQTGVALSACGEGFSPPNPCPGGEEYLAIFGKGGSFTMTGPAGLTFTGVVTSGIGAAMGTLAGGSVSYFGQWSDGLYGDGSASFTEFFPGEFEVTLNSNIAPEPSSLVLFVFGLLIGAGAIRLKSMSF